MTERILLVDDDEDLLEIVSERLINRGMHVDTAGSAEEALNRIGKKDYHAIVLDFLMPGLDGFENIKAIKKQYPKIRIILMTGQMMADEGQEAMRMGADVVLEKPADLDVLIQSIWPPNS